MQISGPAYWQSEDMTVYHGDCLMVMAGLAEASVDLIAMDPPYYKVKDEPWDRQWDTVDGFLGWVETLCQEWRRILKPNGSLYVFAAPQRGMARRVANVVEEHFNILNEIRWYKEDGWHKKAEIETLRQNLMPWDGIIFAEHYGADGYAAGEAGWTAKCDDLRGFVFEPLRAYLAGEWRRAGLEFARANDACGTANMAARHYFARSQWCLPTPEHYASLQRYANAEGQRPAASYAEYHEAPRSRFEPGKNGDGPEYLRADYEDLRADYEDLRRPFFASKERPYTDVWTFATVQSYPGKHPAEKPIALMEHIVETSSRPGDVVADFTMGHGTTLRAAANLGRRGIGADASEHWCRKTVERLAQMSFVSAALT